MRRRLAVVLSHPIQHFCPLYTTWAKSPDWDTHVFFGSRAGAAPYFDANYGRFVEWASLSLDLFSHSFLNGDAVVPITNKLDSPVLEERLDGFRPCAVLTYGYNQRLQRRAQAWARRRRVPLLFFSDAELRHQRPAWKEAIKAVALPPLLRSMDWFIVTGNANEEFYRRYGVPAAKMVRGSYPIDRDAYSRAHADRAGLRANARLKLGIRQDEVVITTVGKLVPWKRQVDLINAMANLSGSKTVALIVGTGPMEQDWVQAARRLSHNRAIFAGFVPTEGLPAVYAATDIYVHASEKEPHSVAISEAVFMGLPVVLSDRCGSYGMDDDVRQGINGFVYKCGDILSLAGVLERLSGDQSLRSAMGKKSHDIGVSQQGVIHDQFLATLDVLLGPRSIG